MPSTPLDRIFEDVQLNIDFSKEVTGATKLLDNVLYSNLVESETASSGSNTNNIAVSFAKLYTWAQDLFTFSPSGTKKIEIKSSALPSGIGNTYSFQEGSIAGSFQVKENQGSWQTIAVHNVATLDSNGKVPSSELPDVAKHLYRIVNGNGLAPDQFKLQTSIDGGTTWTDVDTTTLGLLATTTSGKDVAGKILSSLLPSYVDDIIDGYFHYTLLTTQPTSFDPTKYFKLVDGKYVPGTSGEAWAANTWYTPNFYEDNAYAHVITGESGKIYVDLTSNHSYRCVPGTPEVWVDISNPIDAATIYELLGITDVNGNFVGATSNANGVHGLVPAPLIADKDKFLKGDGTWATVSITDTKVKQNISSANTDFPLLLSYYDKTSSTTTAQTVNRVASIYANPSTGNITATSFNGLTLTAPGSGDSGKFLTGAGTWATPTNTTYAVSGAYGTGNKTWVTTLTADGSTAAGTSTVPTASTSVYGITSLSSSTSSSAEDVAATPKAVKAAYDLANGKSTVSVSNLKSSGTKIATITVNGTANNVYVEDMTTATSGAAGTRGTVQAPANSMDKYLRGDATWVEPVEDFRTKVNNETFTLVLNCTNGRTTTS